MSYLNPYTHNLDGPDADGSPRPDTVGTLLPKLAVRAHSAVLAEVAAERARQDAKWGEQNHPDGTGGEHAHVVAENRRAACQRAAAEGRVTWRHILAEETHEAFAEDDPAKLRAELVQVAAVATAWVEAIDRRAADTARLAAARGVQ